MFSKYLYQNNSQPTPTATAAEIAAELAKINPTMIRAATPSTDYVQNPYTNMQLAQLSRQNNLLSPKNQQYQQYLAKMAGYGAGAGKTAPAITSGDK